MLGVFGVITALLIPRELAVIEFGGVRCWDLLCRGTGLRDGLLSGDLAKGVE